MRIVTSGQECPLSLSGRIEWVHSKEKKAWAGVKRRGNLYLIRCDVERESPEPGDPTEVVNGGRRVLSRLLLRLFFGFGFLFLLVILSALGGFGAFGGVSFVAASLDHDGVGFFPPPVVGSDHFLDEFWVLGGEAFLASGVFLYVEEIPAFGGADSPVELGIVGRVGGFTQTFTHFTQGGALALVFFTLGVVTGDAAEEEVVAFADGAEGVLVRGGGSAGPATDVVVEHAVFIPVEGFYGFKEWREAEAFELGGEGGGDFYLSEFAESG